MKRPKPQRHWTERSSDDYKSRLTFDFLTQLTDHMDKLPMSQADLAEKLGIGESAVSQILNNPSNLTLKTIIRYTRALGMKVSLLAYDDNDPTNTRGPIGSEVFTQCWERVGKPRNLSAIDGLTVTFGDFMPTAVVAEKIGTTIGFAEYSRTPAQAVQVKDGI